MRKRIDLFKNTRVLTRIFKYGFCCPIFSQLYSANLLQNLLLRFQTIFAPYEAETSQQLRTCYPLFPLTVRDLLSSIRYDVSASIFRQQGALRVSEFLTDLRSQCRIKVVSSSWYQGISSSSSLTPHGEKAARANNFTNCAESTSISYLLQRHLLFLFHTLPYSNKHGSLSSATRTYSKGPSFSSTTSIFLPVAMSGILRNRYNNTLTTVPINIVAVLVRILINGLFSERCTFREIMSVCDITSDT